MKEDINFITGAQRLAAKQRRIALLATLVAAGVFGFAVVVGVGVFSVKLLTARQLETQELEIQRLQQLVSQFSQTEQRQQLIVNRLKSIKSILSVRPEIQHQLQQLTETLPDLIEIKNIEISAKDESAKVHLASASYTGFLSVIEALEGSNWEEINISGIKRNREGVYQLALEVVLP